MGFCHRCGDLVHGANCLKCGGRSVMSVTSGLASTGSRNDPWINAYQNILEGGILKPNKRMSLPATSPLHKTPTSPPPLASNKQCHGCSKPIYQAKVYVEPGKPNFIYCEKCHIEKFTKGNCPSCFKPVLSKTDPYVTHAKRSWHTACFICFKCRADLTSNPMVDLRGRPCCENCLMAQAGPETDQVHPFEQHHLQDNLALTHRSLTGSPALSASPRSGITQSPMDHGPESTRLRPGLLPLDVETLAHLAPAQNSPLSAQSSYSQSSLAASYRQNTSGGSGYTSGTSSTYSSLGRKRSSSSALPIPSATSTLRSEHGSSFVSPVLSYQRPGSALSIHSYASSRPTSPALYPDTRTAHSRQGSGTCDPGTVTTEGYPSQGLHRSRSRSLVGLEDLPGNTVRASQPSPAPDNRSNDPGRSRTPIHERPLPSVSDLSTSAAKLSISTGVHERSAGLAQGEAMRPKLTRVRSRSNVGPASAGMVRARTEAWMNHSERTSPPSQHDRQALKPTPLSTSQRGTDLKSPSSSISALAQSPRENEQKSALLEQEPNRSSLHRHGRQRSNTVGEAISFPAVSVDSLASPTLMRGSIPENNCHKCLEKVKENGIRLQNGDRYHIGCFLCFGCKQVFTESEFHIVFGRPYHPGCVSMAGPNSSTSTLIRCNQCQKVIGNKSIRFGGLNYHPQCFTCTHCQRVLQSTSRFFEVDGRVECEGCCEERDRVRLAPKMVPVARATDHFPVPPAAVPVTQGLEPSGPGMMTAAAGSMGNLSRSGSGFGYSTQAIGSGSPGASGASSPLRSPGSPAFRQGGGHGSGALSPLEQDVTSPVQMMASPLAVRSTPPVLTSLFSTRTRPLPKFGGVTTCPRCQQPVGVMDQVPGPKNEKWHKKCLNCKECKKVLDSSAMTRGEGEAYCRGCFNKTRVKV